MNDKNKPVTDNVGAVTNASGVKVASRYANEAVSYTLSALVEMKNAGAIYLDETFQRWQIWPLKSKQSYIQLLYEGNYPGMFVYANIDKCRENIDPLDDYFDSILEKNPNAKHTSIDANNRLCAIAEFMNDEFKVQPSGQSRAKYFSEFKPQVQEMFKNIVIDTRQYTNVSHEFMSKIFIALNESVKLSTQEVRNAQIGKISAWMRDFEPTVRNTSLFMREDNKQRKNDEECLKMLSLLIDYTVPPTKKRLDRVWKNNLLELSSKTNTMKNTFKVLKKYLGVHKYEKRHHLAATIDLFILTAMLKNIGEFETQTKNKIIELFALKRAEVFEEQTVVLNDTNNTEMMYSVLVSAQPFSPHWFKARLDTLCERVLDPTLAEIRNLNLQPKGTRISETGSMLNRQRLAIKQNYTCPLTGKSIVSWSDTKEWEVDHIISIANGGTNAFENLQLVCKQANRSKGKG